MTLGVERVCLLVLFIVSSIVYLVAAMYMSNTEFALRTMYELMCVHIPTNLLGRSHRNECLHLRNLLSVSQFVLQRRRHATLLLVLLVAVYSRLLRNMVQVLWIEVEVFVENAVRCFVAQCLTPTRIYFDLGHAFPCTQMH